MLLLKDVNVNQTLFGRKLRNSLIAWIRNYSMYRAPFVRDEQNTSRLLCAVLSSFRLQQVLKASRSHGKNVFASRPSYYDILKLTPKATQAQVKDAYYKLSKMYHPDQYKGNEDPSVKFREITEAYEVLGNFKQRKMYDRGLLGVTPAATPAEAEEYSSRLHEVRRRRGWVPTHKGRTPIYNFDEWSKLHYQSARERRDNAKMRYEELLRERDKEYESKRSQSIICIMLMTVLFGAVHYGMTENYDQVKPKNK